jgi:acyl carrier protein
MRDIRKEVIEVLAEHSGLSVDEIKDNSHITDDLGMDSLDNVEAVMALEERFDIEIPDEDAEKLFEVQDIVKYIEGRLK